MTNNEAFVVLKITWSDGRETTDPINPAGHFVFNCDPAWAEGVRPIVIEVYRMSAVK